MGRDMSPNIWELDMLTEAEIRRVFAKPPKQPPAPPRSGLSSSSRKTILAKTNGTCHVCGGLAGDRWQADHVIQHSRGGAHSLDNYLPICRECNRLRWSYNPEMLRLMLRFGILAKQEIRHDTKLGRSLLGKMLRRQARSLKRRRTIPIGEDIQPDSATLA
jgi:5-methylcytosine-specific restriction endonuclease McrA